jgi:hypothetical protein
MAPKPGELAVVSVIATRLAGVLILRLAWLAAVACLRDRWTGNCERADRGDDSYFGFEPHLASWLVSAFHPRRRAGPPNVRTYLLRPR